MAVLSPPRRAHARRLVLVAAIALCLLASCGAAAQERAAEQAVKSAYLFRFGDYVEWPSTAFPEDSPYVIGVLGEDTLGPTLDEAVRGRSVAGRPIVVRRLDSLEQVRGVHVLYISPTSAPRRADVHRAVQGRGILTVSDKAAGSGAIIDFVLEDDKVRFEIDAGAARQSGLSLSSKLLSLAVAVKR